jgi:3-methyladenine DNA glycosylase/8-oxoguanine DNA glycosylase
MDNSTVIDLKTENRFSFLIPGPFDFRLTVAKPAGWHWSTLNEVFKDGIFWSGMYLNDLPIGLRMSSTGAKVNVVAFSTSTLSSQDITLLKSIIRSGLGVNEDLPAFYQFSMEDPILAVTVKDLYGMRIGLLDDIFGRVILAILLQMAPITRSQQMMASILEYYGNKIAFQGKEIVLWLRAGDIARTGEQELRQKTKLGYRAKRLVQAAQFLIEHPMSLIKLSGLSDEEAVKRLTEIPGIGRYSAGIIYGRNSLPVDAWSVVVLSELFLGKTPENPRQDIDPLVTRLNKQWGRWSFFAFAYIANDLEELAKSYKLSRVH